MMRVAIGPAYRHRISEQNERAERLNVWVSTWHLRGDEWRVKVWRSDPQTFVVSAVELRASGDVRAIIDGALDDFEERYTDAVWTPEELFVVAHQSGLVR